MKRPFTLWHTLHNEFGSGSWSIVDGMLTVNTANGARSAPMKGNLTAPILARLLMWGMVSGEHTDEISAPDTDHDKATA